MGDPKNPYEVCLCPCPCASARTAGLPCQWNLDYKQKHKLKCPRDVYTWSPGFVWIEILLFNQLAEFWVAYFRVFYFPATSFVSFGTGVCNRFSFGAAWYNIMHRAVIHVRVCVKCLYCNVSPRSDEGGHDDQRHQTIGLSMVITITALNNCKYWYS